MIIIFSTEADYDSQSVIGWLSFLNEDYVLISSLNNELKGDITFSIQNLQPLLRVNGKKIDRENLKSVWFRRSSTVQLSQSIEEDCRQYLTREYQSYLDSIKYLLESNHSCLGSHSKGILNKLSVLNDAELCGLSIPETILSNCKKSVFEFIKSINGKVIVKAISDTITFERQGKVYTSYANEIGLDDLEEMELKEFPVLCQRKIEKEFEIRTFYLESEFYSMAIFSQMDESASTDFRASQSKKKVRKVPFQLSGQIENKLQKLMTKIGLNTGSIDLIRSSDGQTYFLEVNPAGQIGMTSKPCNYYLEKKIAHYLSENP